MSLFDKSEQNFEVAEIAEGKCYYDVAVSRLYYSNFQRMKNFLNNKKNKKINPNLKNTVMSILFGIKKYGSHQQELIQFSEYLQNKDIAIITKFINQKLEREKADYKENAFMLEDYKDVKENAIYINDYIDKNNFLVNHEK